MKIISILLITITITISSCSEKKDYSTNEIKALEELAANNDEKAQQKLLKYYEIKAGKGDKKALHKIGEIFYKGYTGKWKNKINFSKLLEIVINHERTNIEDKEVRQDLQKAIELADSGDKDSQYKIGKIYCYTGTNLKKGINLLQKAADQKHPLAQVELGGMYYIGIGVKQDLVKAIDLLKKADDQGNNDYAKAVLGMIYCMETDLDLGKEGIKLLQKAADSENIDIKYRSKFVLAQMYDKGIGVTKDIHKAIELYQQAADKGDVKAQQKLKTILQSS